MREVLVVAFGNENSHDLYVAGQAMVHTLRRAGRPAIWGFDTGVFADQRVNLYDCVVLATCPTVLTAEEQKGLDRYIRAGGGFVGVHACNLFAESGYDVFGSTIGSRVRGHSPHGRFRVRIVADHPVTRGLEDFDIEDEMFVTEWIGKPRQVLAAAEHEGREHPMVYVQSLDKGRTAYIALGHDGRAWHNPGFIRLLLEAVNWAGIAGSEEP